MSLSLDRVFLSEKFIIDREDIYIETSLEHLFPYHQFTKFISKTKLVLIDFFFFLFLVFRYFSLMFITKICFHRLRSRSHLRPRPRLRLLFVEYLIDILQLKLHRIKH